MAPYYAAIEPLLDRHAGAELAAAALFLMDQAEAEKAPTASPESRPPQAWVRLFVSAGQRDGIGAREVLGAVTGESGVKARAIGKIDVRDSYSLVEVAEDAAATVIKALNGVTLGGRSLRVDYDRARDKRGGGGRRGPGQGGPGGRRRGGPPAR